MNKILLFFILKYGCDWERVYQALENREIISQSDIDGVEEKIDCKYISIIDEQYPNYLKKVYKPSFIIFYLGDLTIVREKLFSFDGKMNRLSKNILQSEEAQRLGNIILNGDDVDTETLDFLLQTKLKFALVFQNICSNKCRETISFLKENTNSNWVVISENYLDKNIEIRNRKDILRMIFPNQETVILSSPSSIKNLKEKINFWDRENIRVLNVLEKNSKNFSVKNKLEKFLTINSPKDIKVFVNYKN